MLPEHPIVISPTLAATIGLEEAVMLQTLSELIKHRGVLRHDRPNIRWASVDQRLLDQTLPFWTTSKINQVLESLLNLGLIVIDASNEDSVYWMALAQDVDKVPASSFTLEGMVRERAAPRTRSDTAAVSSAPGAAGVEELLSIDWQPGDNWVKHCLQHAIPEEFVYAQVPEFVSYWRDRARLGNVGKARFSWGNTFCSHVRRQWAKEQSRQGAFERASDMNTEWRPSEDAVGLLKMGGVDTDFINQNIREFVFRCKEKGEVTGSWNTYFIDYIRNKWVKHTATAGQDVAPRVIPPDWQPNAKCWDMIHLAEIDKDFAKDKIPQFVMYWQDAGEAKSSWNSAFFTYVKIEWDRKLKLNEIDAIDNGKDQFIAKSTREKVEAKLRQLSDKSWLEQ